MQINSSYNHRYASEVKASFSNYYHAPAKDPIGIALDDKKIAEKASQLKDALDGVDLHNVTSQQLADIGVKLYAAGEISDNTAINFVVGNSNIDRNTAFDAISYFESGFEWVTGSKDLTSSTYVYSDSLNTLYNIDSVIQNLKGAYINTKA